MDGRPKSVAILGGGPAGSTLAALLARAGVDVTLFLRDKRPPIIVGESLVPAVVPYLRTLGVEQEVASYAVWKGGATFVFDRESRLNIRFDEVRGARTTYSYNVPRDRFDATLLDAARRSGVRIAARGAQLERVEGSERVRLADADRAAAGLEEEPEWIVE